jgi:hypothetical protein
MKKKKLVLITTAIWLVFSLLALSLGGCASTFPEFHNFIINCAQTQLDTCSWNGKPIPCQDSHLVDR